LELLQILGFHVGDAGGLGITSVFVVSLLASSATRGGCGIRKHRRSELSQRFFRAVFKNF
jgi:hypothetical protein